MVLNTTPSSFSTELMENYSSSMEMNTSELEGISDCVAEKALGLLDCYKSDAELVGTLFKAIALGLIILFTIFGNVLVLLSVVVSRNLRSSTHYLIVNLAVADLLLGTTVLPFSAVFEVTGRWYFGQTFCTIWAAVDVLCCTSSILSLCVISLDRYIGVTRPLAYSAIMVGRRTSVLIVLIWGSSLAICIGPLFGWTGPPESNPFTCSVNKEPGYVLFSVTGSFYLPMFIIIGVYWKIYKAAIRQTKFLECGHKTTKQDVTLRVHLGGNRGNNKEMTKFNGGATPKNIRQPCASVASGSVSGGPSDGELSIAVPEPNNINAKNLLNLAPLARPEKSSNSEDHQQANNDPGVVLRIHRGGGGSKNEMASWTGVNNVRLGHAKGKKAKGNTAGGVLGKTLLGNHHNHHHPHPHHHNHNNGSQANSETPSPPSSSPERKLNPGFGKIAKFRRQKKAAKTLAIVVGVFLVCWFPFFFVLPLEALCPEKCKVPSWLFNLLFWLGYFNSCLNPIIYGCTSKEFQRAFRRILCRRLPPRPHMSRAIYRANMCNNNRFAGERNSNGQVNGNAIPLHHWS